LDDAAAALAAAKHNSSAQASWTLAARQDDGSMTPHYSSGAPSLASIKFAGPQGNDEAPQPTLDLAGDDG
jgi:hypothetical protein